MYVCICYGVTDQEIAEVARGGACTLEQIAAECGAGTGCGTCVRKIRDLLDGSPVARGKVAVTTATATYDGRPACKGTGRSSSS